MLDRTINLHLHIRLKIINISLPFDLNNNRNLSYESTSKSRSIKYMSAAELNLYPLLQRFQHQSLTIQGILVPYLPVLLC